MRLTWIKRDFGRVMHFTECHSTFTSFSAKTSQSHMGLCSDCQPKSRLYAEIQEVWTADLVALAAHIGFQGVFCLSCSATPNVQSQGIKAAEQNPHRKQPSVDSQAEILSALWNISCFHVVKRSHIVTDTRVVTTATHANVGLCCLDAKLWSDHLYNIADTLLQSDSLREFLWMPQHMCDGGSLKLHEFRFLY